MELRGEGENQTFACVCGYREKLSAFKERRAKAGANKSDVRRYMANQQKQETGNSALAEQLAKWAAAKKED
jgi:DNA topoisomerase-3